MFIEVWAGIFSEDKWWEGETEGPDVNVPPSTDSEWVSTRTDLQPILNSLLREIHRCCSEQDRTICMLHLDDPGATRRETPGKKRWSKSFSWFCWSPEPDVRGSWFYTSKTKIRRTCSRLRNSSESKGRAGKLMRLGVVTDTGLTVYIWNTKETLHFYNFTFAVRTLLSLSHCCCSTAAARSLINHHAAIVCFLSLFGSITFLIRSNFVRTGVSVCLHSEFIKVNILTFWPQPSAAVLNMMFAQFDNSLDEDYEQAKSQLHCKPYKKSCDLHNKTCHENYKVPTRGH